MRARPRSDSGQRVTGTAASMTTFGWVMKTQRRTGTSLRTYTIAAAARTSTRTCSVSSAFNSANAGVVFTE